MVWDLEYMGPRYIDFFRSLRKKKDELRQSFYAFIGPRRDGARRIFEYKLDILYKKNVAAFANGRHPYQQHMRYNGHTHGWRLRKVLKGERPHWRDELRENLLINTLAPLYTTMINFSNQREVP